MKTESKWLPPVVSLFLAQHQLPLTSVSELEARGVLGEGCHASEPASALPHSCATPHSEAR